MKRPNFLLVQSDKHRWDCVGANDPARVRTPHLDRLASEGVNFSHAFCPVPLCVPARTSLLTGQWPTEHLCIANWDSEAPRPHVPGLPTYSQVLREAGYWLGYLGKWHVNREKGPTDYGFHEYLPPWEYAPWRAAQGLPPVPMANGWYGEVDPHITPEQSRLGWEAGRVMEMLDGCAERGRPFFIAWEPPEPHLPSRPPRAFADMYPPQSVQPWPGFDDDLAGKPYAQAQQRRDWGIEDWDWDRDWAPFIARYLAVVSLLDAQIGRVLRHLEELGLSENTFVIYTTDHGDTVGSHRLMDQHFILYDDVVRVPLIVRGPDVALAGQTCAEFVCNALDLPTTFLELAGIPVPETFRGVSLAPVLRGEGGTGRQDILAMYHGNQFGLYSMRMVRDRRWKYIWNPTAEDELYNLENDPGEVHNLARAPQWAAEAARLRRRLVDWMDETRDPLCNQWTRASLLEGRTR